MKNSYFFLELVNEINRILPARYNLINNYIMRKNMLGQRNLLVPAVASLWSYRQVLLHTTTSVSPEY